MHEVISSQITTAAVAVWVLQKLKQCPRLPFINHGTDTLNTIISATLAALTAAGIYFNFDSDAGTLMVTGLTVDNALHFGWEWFTSFVMQETVYRGVVKK